ncbi:MAG: hypothetical protein NTW86_21840 [Candidatus Sumerlaeota bacterium]|nr:hypothetical protein [Candidatus Sumerlaeota bacterium]
MKRAIAVFAVLPAFGLAFFAPRAEAAYGPPTMNYVADVGGGSVNLGWTKPYSTPAQFLGFSWDIYGGFWVPYGYGNSMWYPFASSLRRGNMVLKNTGAYHVWISSQYSNGAVYACANPWTGTVYSGVPHTPLGVTVESLGPQNIRLHWRPEYYGTWLDQAIVYCADEGWVDTKGADGLGQWHFTAYPSADFLNGATDFWVHKGGAFTIFLNFKAWDGTTEGAFASVDFATADAWPEKTAYYGTYVGPIQVQATVHSPLGDLPATGSPTATVKVTELRNIPGTTLYSASGTVTLKGTVTAGSIPYDIDYTDDFTHGDGFVIDRSTMTFNYDSESGGTVVHIAASITTQKATGNATFSGATPEGWPLDGTGTFELTRQP